MPEFCRAPRVIITRPLAQAEPLAARIAQLGRRFEILPLLEIQALPHGSVLQQQLQHALRHLADYALVAFVSPNAIAHCFAQLQTLDLPWPSSTAIAVMGEGSRQALAEFAINGAAVFFPQDKLRTDSETLLQALDLAKLRGQRALIVRGQSGRELLGDALRAAGVEVAQVTAYQRLPVHCDVAMQRQLHTLLKQSNDWLLTSSEALRHLVQIIQKMQESNADYAKLVADLQQQHFIVPHVRIAETAREFGFSQITQSTAGDEGMLTALQSRL